MSRQSLTTIALSFWRVAALAVLASATATASGITYDVFGDIGLTGHISGFIETDGDIGTLAAGDILDWSIGITDGVDTPYTLVPGDSAVTLNGSSLSATLSALLFNFSGGNCCSFYFQSSSNNYDYVCFGPGGAGDYSKVCANTVPSNVAAIGLGGPSTEQSTALTGVQAVASVPTPEPSSAILLAAGLSLVAFSGLRRG